MNDTYGHLCGDEILKQASRRMRACVRSYDIVGRYGGEEFLVVVPSSDRTGTMVLAERIRSALEFQPVRCDVAQIAITGSFGVAACTNEEPYDLTSLLRLVDEALYSAKRKGRNRVEFASSESPAPPTGLLIKLRSRLKLVSGGKWLLKPYYSRADSSCSNA